MSSVAMLEGRRLRTKLSAEPLATNEYADYAEDARAGSAMLRDAILLAKGIVHLPLKNKALPLPVERLPEPCPTCGAPEKPRLLITHIQATVAAYYGLPAEAMTNRQQYHRVSHPRQVAMFLASELTQHSIAEIGRRFNRDHTTAMYAIKAVKHRLETDANALIDVEVLRERLIG
jgi:chromosomal replication initiator protein